MISNKDVSADTSTDFVLKHRITGAAILIVFGVLFLPWLLGAPSEASKTNAELSNERIDDISVSEIEEELLTATENQISHDDIEIYVSKITPLDALSNDDEKDVSAQPSNETTTSETEKLSEETEKTPEPVVAKSSSDTDTAESTAQKEPTPVSQPEPAEEQVSVGWVVQVGVFTDAKGAEKVVADLKAKGFEPSTTTVDTNMGKSTGTRVWLGPYAQRVDAAKSKTSLKDKTGGDGFIRAYP